MRKDINFHSSFSVWMLVAISLWRRQWHPTPVLLPGKSHGQPGRLQSMGSLRVRHDWTTSLSLFTFMHLRRQWQPTPMFLPGESQGRGAWWAAVSGIAQSRTRLKRLSSSSSSHITHMFLPFYKIIGHGNTVNGSYNAHCLRCFKHVCLFVCFAWLFQFSNGHSWSPRTKSEICLWAVIHGRI